MTARKRSLSQAHHAPGGDGQAPPADQDTAAPVESDAIPENAASTTSATEPIAKRHKSDIDIIRARTEDATLSDRAPDAAPLSEPGDAEAEGGDDSSPLKAKSGGGKDGKDKKGRQGPGKKGRGGIRRDTRGEFQRVQAANAAATSETIVPSSDVPAPFGEADGGGAKEDRRPKRKVAVCFGYVGTGYNGSQIQTVGSNKVGETARINPAMTTIEGEVFKAFVQAGCVSEDNSINPNKVGLQRCSRTDAGVHAACNVISLKLVLDPPLLASSSTSSSDSPSHHSQPLISLINSFLPPEIRLWGYVRTLGSFQCRQMCDSRTYEYSLPTYVFLPPKPGTSMDARLRACGGWIPEEKGDGEEPEVRWWESRRHDANFQEDLEQKRAYRISPSMLARVRDAVAQFKGVHNFSNYTVGKEFRDRSATRVVKAVEVSDPFLVEGTEWVSIRLWGQSFMIHQIRKMIGMIILLCRTRTPASLIPETFGPSRVRIPKAPGLGLLLVHPHFTGYNMRVAQENKTRVNLKAKNSAAMAEGGKGSINEGMMEVREELEFERWKEGVDGFKRDMIYKRMWEDEKGEDSFAQWVNFLELMNGPNLDYLNPKGLIPSAASSSAAQPLAQTTTLPVDPANPSAAGGEADDAVDKLFEDEAAPPGEGGKDADDDG